MGMDVYGIKPTDKTGEYFRRNWWGWRPIWWMVEGLWPEISAKVENPMTNDGDGLDDKDSKELSTLMNKAIGNGTVGKFIIDRNKRLDSMPEEPCNLCEGTGKRMDPPNIGAGTYPCNGCNSTGTRANYETYYRMDTNDAKEFSQFLAHCGGFQLY